MSERENAPKNSPEARIQAILGANPIVLFMKGDRAQPMCGFSATVVQVLQASGVDQFHSVNVLEDPAIGKEAPGTRQQVGPAAQRLERRCRAPAVRPVQPLRLSRCSRPSGC